MRGLGAAGVRLTDIWSEPLVSAPADGRQVIANSKRSLTAKIADSPVGTVDDFRVMIFVVCELMT
jgi:hypothetical protein